MTLGGLVGRVAEGVAVGATVATVATAENVALLKSARRWVIPLIPGGLHAYPGFVPAPPVVVPYPVATPCSFRLRWSHYGAPDLADPTSAPGLRRPALRWPGWHR